MARVGSPVTGRQRDEQIASAAAPESTSRARAAWSLARDTVTAFLDESPFQQAAALSFYTLLSLSPLVLIVVGVTGLVWSEAAVREQLLNQIAQLVGPAGAETIGTVLKHAAERGQSITSIVVGFATLLVGATTVFAQLQAALNHMWNVRAAPAQHAVWNLLRTRLLSLALVLTLGFLLLVSLFVSTILAAIEACLSRVAPGATLVWQWFNFGVSLVVIALLVATIFKVLPDVRIRWAHAWFGGFVTSALLGIGKFLIGLYLGQTSLASSYGAAGSLVVFMVWIYYSALIFLLGAELTQMYARHRGAPIEPAAYAELVPRS
jgi:membrane protein